METLRNSLLRCGDIETYTRISSFLQDPIHNSLDEILAQAPHELENLISEQLIEVRTLYTSDRQTFEQEYRFGQAVIWQEVLQCYSQLNSAAKRISACQLCPDVTNYAVAKNDISALLGIYAEMQASLSKLEEILGVDRFLDRVSGATFDVLESILSEAKQAIEDKAKKYKSEFQYTWNTTYVNKVLRHKLLLMNTDNQVCDLVQGGNSQVILFVIDGFGFSQYLWNKDFGSGTENFTFNENIFHWLNRESLSSELVLGSSFITDTGAGLAQIYLGQSSGETGIIASKMKKRDDTGAYIATKSLPQDKFDTLFSYKNSITDLVALAGKPVTVYYCSKYQDPPSGFSKCIFKSASVRSIIPSERVFSILLDDIMAGTIEGLQIVYFTGIDNSGHTMGAYSKLERYEHQKIGYLLRNFIIELASNSPELFDGKRSILITADHGMFESSKKIISRWELSDYLYTAGIKYVKLVENNRAMLLYNNGHSTNEELVLALEQFFESKGLTVDIQSKESASFLQCLGNCDGNLLPDVIVRFIGGGLFYSNLQVNKHLLHFGGHGGYSVDEVFVPLIELPLNSKLLEKIQKRFLSRK